MADPEPRPAGTTYHRFRALLARAGAEPEPDPAPAARPSASRLAALRNDPERTIGDYVVLAQVAQGGMGRVLQAWDAALDRPVALKLLHREGALRDVAPERFVREARVLAQLDHPHIVAVHGLGFHRGEPFLVMDWVEGRTLAEAARGTPIDAERAFGWMLPIVDALAHVHAQGILHRDIKPSNVMLDEGRGRAGAPVPKLIDFGLARSVLAAAGAITQMGVGTPAYTAPEQARGDSAQVGPRSEVYGVGATLFTLLTGCPPEYRDEARHDDPAIVEARVVPPREFLIDLDPAAEALVLKAMDPDPARRQADMAELRREMESWLAGSARRSRTRAAQTAPGGGWTRREWVFAAGAIVFVALAAAVGVMTERRLRAERLVVQRWRAAEGRIRTAAIALERAQALSPLTDAAARRVELEAARELADSARGEDESQEWRAHEVWARATRLLGDAGDERAYGEWLERMDRREARLLAGRSLEESHRPFLTEELERESVLVRSVLQGTLDDPGLARLRAWSGGLPNHLAFLGRPDDTTSAAGRALIARAEALRAYVRGAYQEAWTRSLAALPWHPTTDGYLLLAAALEGLGRTDESVRAWESALALEPGLALARQRLIEALLRRRDYEAARRTIDEAKPLPEARWRRYDAILSSRELDRSTALARLRRLSEEHPDEPGLAADLAVFALLEGDLDIADSALAQTRAGRGERRPSVQERYHEICLRVQQAARPAAAPGAMTECGARLAELCRSADRAALSGAATDPADPISRVSFAFRLTAGGVLADPLLEPLRRDAAAWKPLEDVLGR